MKLDELQVYQLSMQIGEQVWNIIDKWNYFDKDTIGKQLIKSVDSIAANLSEGFGRYFYKEERQFCYYSRGSLFETVTRITKAHNRNLINDNSYELFIKDINRLGVKLNNYINSISKKNIEK
ncbi:MAG: four helix bundle protein [Ignavibacteriales bacterium]|nr:four helix bundle protein [Ignavibacteriales bacterium]